MSSMITDEKLVCKFCKTDLTETFQGRVGFVSCPGCNKSFLKLPQKALHSKNNAICESRKKVLNIYESSLKVDFHSSQNSNEHNTLREELLQTQKLLADALKGKENALLNFEEANEEIKRIREIIEERNAQISSLKTEIEKLSAEFQLKDNLFGEMEKESTFKNLSFANVSKEMIELKQGNIELERARNDLENELAKREQEIKNLKLTLDVLPELEFELDRSKVMIQELKQVNNFDEIHMRDINVDQVEILNDEIHSLKNEINEYCISIDEYKERINDLDSIRLSNEDEIRRLNRIIDGHDEKGQLSLFSTLGVDYETKLSEKEGALKNSEERLESLEMELEISRDELANAKKEINELNGLLEKAFYENQKANVANDANAPSNKVIDAVREIEKREENLSLLQNDMNNKIQNLISISNGQKTLTKDIVLKLELGSEIIQETIFNAGTLLPAEGQKLVKEQSRTVSFKKGAYQFKHDDQREHALTSAFIDFSSNLHFFLNKEEWENLSDEQVEVHIQEEYFLSSDGMLTLNFYRNNGFKRFQLSVGKVMLDDNLGFNNIIQN